MSRFGHSRGVVVCVAALAVVSTWTWVPEARADPVHIHYRVMQQLVIPGTQIVPWIAGYTDSNGKQQYVPAGVTPQTPLLTVPSVDFDVTITGSLAKAYWVSAEIDEKPIPKSTNMLCILDVDNQAPISQSSMGSCSARWNPPAH